MSLSEMSVIARKEENQMPDDVFDNGFLRVEHRNYYVACGGTPIKLPRTEFLIFSRLTRTPELTGMISAPVCCNTSKAVCSRSGRAEWPKTIT